MNQDFYIYAHRRLDTGEVFYVGKGRARRAWQRQSRSRWWKAIVDKAGFEVEIMATSLSEDEAFKQERSLIAEFRGRATPLCNMTDGGNGGDGSIHWSIEGREKTIVRCKIMAEKQRGMPLSDAHREALSRSLKGASKTLEHRKKISASNKGKKLSPEHLAILRKPKSVETKMKLRLARLGTVATAATREKMSVAQRGRIHSEQTRRKISKGQLGIKRSPQAVANMRAARWGNHANS
jgi:hypothetical protein